MVKSLKKSAKRAADDRQQDPSAANIDPRTEAEHSEENIEMLGESFLFEDVFSVKGLLAQIM